MSAPVVPPEPDDTTALLRRAAGGEAEAEQLLYTHIYKEMRRMAAAHLARERPGHTLQPTALVHEAYIQLIRIKQVEWADKGHFFAMSARIMRRILVDHARENHAKKRGGGLTRVNLDGVFEPVRDGDPLLIALDQAMERLEKQSPRAYKLVELKFFAGLGFEEAALALNVSSRTLKRDWEAAKRILYRDLQSDGS